MNTPEKHALTYRSPRLSGETLEESKLCLPGALPYGAAPLAAYSSELHKPQLQLSDNLHELILSHETDSPFSQSVVEMAEKMYYYIDTISKIKNDESFRERLESDIRPDDLPYDQKIIYEKAHNGTASPAELIFLREALGMKSIELAKLTHPYGVRIEYLEDLRRDVKNAIYAVGGVYDQSPQSVYEIIDMGITQLTDIQPTPDAGVTSTPKKRLRTPNTVAAILRTKRIGSVTAYDGETYINERTAFLFNFRNMLGERSHDSVVSALSHLKPDAGRGWRDQLDGLGTELQETLDEATTRNDFETTIPVATAVFAENPIVNQIVLDRRMGHVALSLED